MTCELLAYYILHPLKLRDIAIIQKYRCYHEQETTCNMAYFAQKNKVDEKYATELINEWMQKRPLKWIKIFADKKLLNLLENKQVVVFSDYPTEDKLKALNFEPYGQYYCDNKNIYQHKPCAEGLEYIQQKYKLQKSEMLMIGDRHAYDGKCAENFGCDYVILSSNYLKRQKQYSRLL